MHKNFLEATSRMQSANQEIFLGCQPILDRRQSVCGYELLFRSGENNSAAILDDLQASASVISYAFGDLGISASLGKGLVYLNVSQKLLLSGMLELLPKDRVMLELLESVRPEDAVLDRCRELKAKGFHLALDDFECGDEQNREKLIALADLVKVDITRIDRAKLTELARCMRRWPVKLLAEKVESQADVEQCLDAGFELFQGYFFARPHMIIGKRVDPSHITLLNLLGVILDEADVAEIERLFKPAPDLSYNLLRLVNSVASGTHRRIGSLKQAIVVLGQQQLLRWLQLLLFARRDGDVDSNPLLLLAARRGRLLELLVEHVDQDGGELRDRAFMTGILSLLDALFNQPLGEIISQISVASEVRQALLERSGKLGAMLTLAECLERNDFHGAQARMVELGLGMDDLMHAQVAAMTWAAGVAGGASA